MRKSTAEKVADLLGMAEELLTLGRPRKRPHQPRPEATDFWGEPIQRVHLEDFFKVCQFSLPAALRIAAQEEGYSRHVYNEAIWHFLQASNNIHLYTLKGFAKAVRQVDDEAWDTRWLRRDLRKARKTIEKGYGLR